MVRPTIVGKLVGAGAAPVNAVETVIFSTDPISTSGPGAKVTIKASFAITPGATTTSITINCRRGAGITGALVGVGVTTLPGAATAGFYSAEWVDTVGDVAGQVYSITVTQNAGTANGAVTQCNYEVTAE